MNKPEYSDLYKFIVSLGIMLIAFAVLLPWLFLRESFDTLVNASDIANLTSSAQTLITYRQSIALWFMQNIFWISAIPALAGLIILIIGFVLWQRKQDLIDQKDLLENKKLELEIKKMSPEQIAVKAVKEANENIQTESGQVDETSAQVNAINQYFHAEKLVIQKLINCFGTSNVRSHLKVRNTEIDILVRISPRERAILEIKLLGKPTNIARRIREINEYLLQAVKTYNTIATERNTHGIGLLIVKEEAEINNIIENYEKVATFVDFGIFTKIIIITENEFNNLTCKDLNLLISRYESK